MLGSLNKVYCGRSESSKLHLSFHHLTMILLRMARTLRTLHPSHYVILAMREREREREAGLGSLPPEGLMRAGVASPVWFPERSAMTY